MESPGFLFSRQSRPLRVRPNLLDPSVRAKAWPMLSFSAGKGTALVVDVGEETTSVIPVHDGFVLRKGAAALSGLEEP